MVIRPATPEDVPDVLPMVRAIAALHAGWDPEKYALRGDPGESYRAWLTRRAGDERAVFLVADAGDEGGGLAGFLVGAVEQDIPIYRTVEHGFVHDVWVEPAYRRRGVARSLVEAALRRFGEIGVSQVRLDTASANEAARSLFRELGFRESLVMMLRRVDGAGGR